jgi:hypothetical protein
MTVVYTSQIPPVAARYFDDRGCSAEHPQVVSIFRGHWTWLACRRYVSHSLLVDMAAEGVTAVVLSCQGREADFTTAELIGNMGALDAEMTDGVPQMEGTSATRTRQGMTELLAGGLHMAPTLAEEILAEADRSGRTEFVTEERGHSAADPRGELVQGWRYRLARRHGGRYELTVVTHEKA